MFGIKVGGPGSKLLREKKFQKSFKKVFQKLLLLLLQSALCCYQTAKARTLCVCNSKINRLRKKVLNVYGLWVVVLAFARRARPPRRAAKIWRRNLNLEIFIVLVVVQAFARRARPPRYASICFLCPAASIFAKIGRRNLNLEIFIQKSSSVPLPLP